jgi:hypothetical protein
MKPLQPVLSVTRLTRLDRFAPIHCLTRPPLLTRSSSSNREGYSPFPSSPLHSFEPCLLRLPRENRSCRGDQAQNQSAPADWRSPSLEPLPSSEAFLNGR